MAVAVPLICVMDTPIGALSCVCVVSITPRRGANGGVGRSCRLLPLVGATYVLFVRCLIHFALRRRFSSDGVCYD